MYPKDTPTRRVDNAGVWLWNERSLHFTTAHHEVTREPYLTKSAGDDMQLDIELINDRWDVWLRLFNYDGPDTPQLVNEVSIAKGLMDTRAVAGVVEEFTKGYPDITDRLCLFPTDEDEKPSLKPKPFNVEVTLRVMASDADEAWTMVDADLRHYLTEPGSGLDWQVTEGGVTEIDFIDQPVAPKAKPEYVYPDIRASIEYGIKADIERDDNDEMFVRIADSDVTSLIAVYGPDQTPLAGIDLRHNRVDLGRWVNDEWLVTTSIALDGSAITIQ